MFFSSKNRLKARQWLNIHQRSTGSISVSASQRDYYWQPCVGVLIVHCYSTDTGGYRSPAQPLCTDHSLSLERLFNTTLQKGPPLSSRTESRLSNPSPLYRFWGSSGSVSGSSSGSGEGSPGEDSPEKVSQEWFTKGNPYSPGLYLSPAPSPAPASPAPASSSEHFTQGLPQWCPHGDQ